MGQCMCEHRWCDENNVNCAQCDTIGRERKRTPTSLPALQRPCRKPFAHFQDRRNRPPAFDHSTAIGTRPPDFGNRSKTTEKRAPARAPALGNDVTRQNRIRLRAICGRPRHVPQPFSVLQLLAHQQGSITHESTANFIPCLQRPRERRQTLPAKPATTCGASRTPRSYLTDAQFAEAYMRLKPTMDAWTFARTRDHVARRLGQRDFHEVLRVRGTTAH